MPFHRHIKCLPDEASFPSIALWVSSKKKSPLVAFSVHICLSATHSETT
jgi:hypothetical protein